MANAKIEGVELENEVEEAPAERPPQRRKAVQPKAPKRKPGTPYEFELMAKPKGPDGKPMMPLPPPIRRPPRHPGDE
jgi:hypothetical protein